MIHIILYIVLTAASTVLVHILGIKIPDLLMVTLTTGYAILFFNVINYKKILTVYRKLLESKKLFLIISVSVMIMWAGSFYVPIYYSPAIHIFTFMSLTSFYGSLFTYIKNKKIMEGLKALMIFLLLSLFYYKYYQYYLLSNFLKLFFATLVTGSSCYVYIYYSYQMNNCLNFKATEVLAIRYWLLMCIAFIMMINNKEYLEINGSILIETAILSFMLLICPIFFMQKAIESIGGYLTAILMGLTPMMTFLLEKITLNPKDNMIGYFSIVLALIILFPYLISYLNRRTNL